MWKISSDLSKSSRADAPNLSRIYRGNTQCCIKNEATGFAMSLAIKGIETDNCKKKGGNFVCKTYKDLMTQHTKNSPVAGRVAEPDSWPAQCLIEKRIVHLKGTVGAVNCRQLHLSMRFTSEHLFVLESTEDDLPANCLLLRLHKKAG